jgi:hypothetical protein
MSVVVMTRLMVLTRSELNSYVNQRAACVRDLHLRALSN